MIWCDGLRLLNRIFLDAHLPDEAGYHFSEERFVPGEYISVNEEGRMHPFRVVSVARLRVIGRVDTTATRSFSSCSVVNEVVRMVPSYREKLASSLS